MEGGSGGGIVGVFIALIQLAIIVGVVGGMWKTFAKAGKPGWGALIPIYNIILLLEIVGRPMWWILLMFIPFVNLIVAFLLSIGLAKSFGKDVGFGIGLLLFPFVCYPMLGFGDAKYQGPAAAA
jgi:hypothetical protein